MKKTIIIISAAILAITSCTKEITAIPETASSKFTASIEQEITTKTKLGDNGLDVLWKTGDAISINGCTYLADKSGVQSPFTASGAEATANESSPKYTAIYPASMADNVLPDVQDYKEGSLKSMPMYATSNTADLYFKNICAVLAVTVPSSITTVRSIEVSSSNRALSGAFTISADNVLVLTDTTNYSNTMTLECGSGVSNPGTFYIAIPAGKYKELKITVCDGSNNYSMTTKSGKYITVERNKMYPISFTAQTTDDNPFRITALEGACHIQEGANFYAGDDICFDDAATAMPFISFKISTNGGETWTEIEDPNFIDVWLPKGESLIIKSVERADYFQGIEDNEFGGTQCATIFTITGGKAKISGDIMTLFNRTESTDKNAGDYTFAGLFANSTSLVSARDLILPDNVGAYCYLSTFRGCTALKEAPVLPATSLASNCYKNMFNGCSSLNYIKMLATDISATDCMSYWVDGVASTGTFVKNPAATWDVVGVHGVPEGWVPVKEYEYVDLGLSVKWATCNVGATNPEDYGDYYGWGETATKSDYGWPNYSLCNGTYTTLTKYNTNSSVGVVDNKTILDLEDDVAHVKWGDNWRMPTYEEVLELKNNCKWTWTTTSSGISGYLVTGTKAGYTDKSIFLPAAGYKSATNSCYTGKEGCYWSTNLDTSGTRRANYMDFESYHVSGGCSFRFYGYSIRPVCE